MKRGSFLTCFIAAMALAVGFGLWQAQPSEAQGRPKFSLPPGAVEVAPFVFFLGTAIDNGRVVEGYAFVHPTGRTPAGDQGGGTGHGRGGGGGGNGGGDDAECFSFISRGARWNSPENYLFNPITVALTTTEEDLVGGAFDTAILEWEGNADPDPSLIVEIIGDRRETGDTLTADVVAPDNDNEFYFADIDTDLVAQPENVIAVTIVWGIFRGPPVLRGLVEWDMVFDDMDFTWSIGDTPASGEMDFANIATHEIGHAVGMDHTLASDSPTSSDTCFEQTMYPFAASGETIKRDVAVGDINGIQELYK